MNEQQAKIRALILDMDGVLWRDDRSIGYLPDIFERIRKLDLGFTLATNNATKSVEQYLEKLAGFGVQLDAWQIVNSPQAAVWMLKQKFPDGGGVFVVGETGLVDTLAAENYFLSDENVCAVIVGLDRMLTYEKIHRAARLIRSGALFIGTNPDSTYPVPDGLAPGAGAVIAAVQAASGVSPMIAGKPGPIMYHLALERLNVDPIEAVGIGDRLETDIAGAQACGCRTALVLSGVSTAKQASLWQPAPDWIAPDLAALITKFERDRA